MYRYSPLFHIQPQNILRTYYSLITKVFLFVLQELGVSKTLRTFCDLSTPESEEDFSYFSPVMSHSGFGLVHFETVVFFPSKQTENTLW